MVDWRNFFCYLFLPRVCILRTDYAPIIMATLPTCCVHGGTVPRFMLDRGAWHRATVDGLGFRGLVFSHETSIETLCIKASNSMSNMH